MPDSFHLAFGSILWKQHTVNLAHRGAEAGNVMRLQLTWAAGTCTGVTDAPEGEITDPPAPEGMTVEEALPWLKENGKDLMESIRAGKYKPTPVRRKEIPKPEGGVRKLGIPTVGGRIVQQAVAQQLMPI